MSHPAPKAAAKPAASGNSLTIDCPQQPSGSSDPAPVPVTFTVSGAYALTFGGESSGVVRCVVTYFDGAGDVTSLGKECILSPDTFTWCCQFDLSSDSPPEGGALLLAAALRNSADDSLLAGPVSKGVKYTSGATDTCSCSGTGTEFDGSLGV